jgi:biotin carboxyl carrier protein
MYQLTINEKIAKEVSRSDTGGVLIDGHEIVADVIVTNERLRHIIYKNKSYSVEHCGIDADTQVITYKINGKLVKVSHKSKLQLLLDKMGFGAGGSTKANDVKAPMPGLIIGISVDVGQAVKKGDVLLILEAMKMENSIKATGDGVVKKVAVSTGDKVEKGSILVQFS